MAIKQPRDHLRRMPTRAELERAGITVQAAPEHPLLTQCKALGVELDKLGVPWGYDVSVNPAEMLPGVMAKALPALLVAKGILTQEEVDNLAYATLLGQMQRVLAIVKAQRAQQASGLVLPDGTPVPADLLPKLPGGGTSD